MRGEEEQRGSDERRGEERTGEERRGEENFHYLCVLDASALQTFIFRVCVCVC